MKENRYSRGMRLSIAFALLFFIVAGLFYTKKIISNKTFEKAEHYFSHENYNVKKAEKLYKISIFIDDSQKGAHYQLGRIYFLGGNFGEAIMEFDKELLYYPENKHPYYMRGLTNGYAKNYDEAIDNFKKFIEWKPETWAGYNDIVWVYLLKKDYESAEEYSKKGLENVSDNPWLLSNLGTAQLNLGKYEEARENLVLAEEYASELSVSDWLETYPGNDPKIGETGLRDMKAAIQLNIATVLKKMGEKEEAREEYQKYLEMLPNDDKRRIPIENFMVM